MEDDAIGRIVRKIEERFAERGIELFVGFIEIGFENGEYVTSTELFLIG